MYECIENMKRENASEGYLQMVEEVLYSLKLAIHQHSEYVKVTILSELVELRTNNFFSCVMDR